MTFWKLSVAAAVLWAGLAASTNSDAVDMKIFGKINEMRVEVTDILVRYRFVPSNFVREEATNVYTNLYLFNAQGNVVDKTYFVLNGNRKYREITDFVDGRHETNREYWVDDRLNSRYAYEYSNNFLLQHEFFVARDGSRNKVAEYHYDEANNLLEKRNFYRGQQTSSIRQTFSKHGMVKSETIENKRTTSYSDYVYDEKGRRLKRLYFYSVLQGAYPAEEYVYDDAGNMIRMKDYRTKNVIDFVEDRTYADGLLVKRNIRNEYTFDQEIKLQYRKDKNLESSLNYNLNVDAGRPSSTLRYFYTFH